MKLTYAQARNEVLETTEIGYTLRSQDRLWLAFMFDTWSEDEWWGNRLYFINAQATEDGADLRTSYDLFEDEVLWTTRREAEAHAEAMRDLIQRSAPLEHRDDYRVYVINLGDDRRAEREYLEGVPFKAHFKGSEAAVEAMRVVRREWANRAALAAVEETDR